MKELKKFKSAFFYAPGKIKVENRDIIKTDEIGIVIKVNSCMICGSDLRIFKEGSKRIKKPTVIGHETSGKIIFSKLKKFKVNDKVSLGADFSKDTDFAFGYEIDGGFSEYITLNKKLALKAPIVKFKKNISFEEASLAEPLACCLNGFEKVNFKKNKIVTIFGAGPIGLMIGKLANRFGAKRVILVDIDKKRLKIGKKILKCNTLHFNNSNFISQFFNLNSGSGSDYIFTANPSVLTHKYALKIANKKSYINLFGGVSRNNSKFLVDSNFIHYNEINLTGSHGSNYRQLKKALSMIENKEVNLKSLITHRFKLKDILKAYRTSMKGKTLKVSIKPN